jgi:NAD(P)-dependent dehydrogenase (short-subunit alcohol dehydrogenase family)
MMTNPTQTVIITGGNSGIGYECARSIAAAQQGWQIVLTSRDQHRAEQAAMKIQQDTHTDSITPMALDLGSLDSVRNFAKAVLTQGFPPLRGLVCNAGYQVAQGLTYTQDGFEATFGINYLGHFLLMQLLLPALRAPARIVLVTSASHDPTTMEGRSNAPLSYDARSLAWPEKANMPPVRGILRYSTSKLCLIYCTYELARRIQDGRITGIEQPITVNAYDPGTILTTHLMRNYPRWVQTLWPNPATFQFFKLLGFNLQTAARAGQGMARLILEPALEGVTGKHFRVMEEYPSSQESYDSQRAAQLWDETLELLELQSQ